MVVVGEVGGPSKRFALVNPWFFAYRCIMSKIGLPSRAAVLELLLGEDHAVHANEVATRLGVPQTSYPGLLRMLDDLVFDGLLQARDGHKFRAVARGKAKATVVADKRAEAKGAPVGKSGRRERETNENDAPPAGYTVSDAPATRGQKAEPTAEKAADRGGAREPRANGKEGILTVNARGFGFVSSEGGTDDTFVPEDALGGALHGDRVIVRIVGRSSRGAEGRIVEIVKRGMTRVVGTLRRRGKSAWLEPDDNRVKGPIVLNAARDTEGEQGNSGTDGQAAVVRITRYPENPHENLEGTIEAILGTPGELSVEAAKILVMAQIHELHEPNAVAEAEAYGTEVPEEMLRGREDLTMYPLPTIDPKDARDHDDAVWVERSGDGGYRVIVAIADVSSYVKPGTAIDEEAKVRGCSVYLPDRAVAMLPRALSSNLCSLLPDVIRLCLAVDAQLDAAGEVKEFRVIRGFMKSQAKLSYENVAQVLGFIEEETPPHPEAVRLLPGLEVAYELSRLLRGKRMRRGALDFELPEPKITLGEGGLPTAITKRSQNPGIKKAYSLIEELMLLANEVVARWLVEKKLPSVFRVHLPPDEKKLEKLAAMCALLGVEFDVAVTKDPKTLAELLKGFAKHPLAPVLNSLLLRSMKQATYEAENLGHFGLASKAYLHFTSPIRRYPDVCVHRTVHALVLGAKPERDKEKLADAALSSSQNERKSMEVERNIVDLYRAFFMKDRIGDRFVGTVSAVVGSGVFVALDDPFVEVLVKLEELGGTDYEVDDVGLRVVGRRSGEVISLGDSMLVEIADVSLQRRSVLGRRVLGARAARANLEKKGTELTIVDDTAPTQRRPRVKNTKPPKGSKNRVVGSRTPKSPVAKAKSVGTKKKKPKSR